MVFAFIIFVPNVEALPMKNTPYQMLLIIIALILLPQTASGFQQRHERDSLKLVRDSLVNLLRVKDSLLLQASLDSLFLNNLNIVLERENDSLQHELRTMILQDKLDSVRQQSIDSINRDFNRYSRWDLRDSLYNIDEDSVRRSLNNLLGTVFHDDAYSPEPEQLRQNMSRLFYHLANDSLHFFIINSQNDTVPFTLKKNYSDSTALFLVNNKQDSVKVYISGRGEDNLYMWADDDFRLSQMFKKKVSPDIIRKEWASISRMKLPRRKVLAAPVRHWSTGADFDLTLNQLAVSHWAKGGSNRITLLATSKGHADYSKGKISWDNDYLYRYGIMKSEGLKLYKNTELLRIKNSFQHKAYKNWNYSLDSQFDSQFFPGYKNPADTIPVSKFLGPGRLNTGIGMTYKPLKELEITGNPLSGQFTFVLDTVTINAKAHGLAAGKRVKSEFGSTILIKYKKVLLKNINLNTSLKLFRSYGNNTKPDIDWITDIKLKINKYMNTSFFLYLKYDDDVILPDYEYIDGVKTKIGEGKFLQVNQTFGITFAFVF